MIHPDTELRFINGTKGRGVFSTKRIPKGTLTYVKDDLEIEIEPDDQRLSDPKYRDLIDTYSFIDRSGKRILSWDHAKYVNHCCQCNTMSTGYGFEIAIRDIAKDEEITDEYSMFNFPANMRLECEKSPCRKVISENDLLIYHKEWDKIIKSSLNHLHRVVQPLAPFLSKETENMLNKYFQDRSQYISVLNLAYKKSD
ncbi:MAG: SET domain-containing protein [Balneolaceae bacterium]|nr:SET domain-containing protein [Balneolaceae bacterium]